MPAQARAPPVVVVEQVAAVPPMAGAVVKWRGESSKVQQMPRAVAATAAAVEGVMALLEVAAQAEAEAQAEATAVAVPAQEGGTTTT